jgi:cyclic-di-GMP-binding protein
MPSFDVVSEVDLQEVRNAVDQANRELTTRFDFRGVDAGFELETEAIVLSAPEEFQLTQMVDMLRGKLVRRNLDPRCLEAGKIEGAGKVRRQRFKLLQGIDKDHSRDIVKRIKDAKIKVQAAIQGEKVRVTGKQRDDLQQAMALLKGADLDIALQFDNFRD